MLEIAQAKASENKVTNVTFQQMSIDKFDVPNQTFDAVFGLSILHLLENKEGVIAKVHKMLKPGGIFVTSTACVGDAISLIWVIAPIGRFF